MGCDDKMASLESNLMSTCGSSRSEATRKPYGRVRGSGVAMACQDVPEPSSCLDEEGSPNMHARAVQRLRGFSHTSASPALALQIVRACASSCGTYNVGGKHALLKRTQ